MRQRNRKGFIVWFKFLRLDWHAAPEMSDDERVEAKVVWNVCEREGYGFAVCAVGRLAIQSPVKMDFLAAGSHR